MRRITVKFCTSADDSGGFSTHIRDTPPSSFSAYTGHPTFLTLRIYGTPSQVVRQVVKEQVVGATNPVNKLTRTQNGPKPTADGKRLSPFFENKTRKTEPASATSTSKRSAPPSFPTDDSALFATDSDPGLPRHSPYLFLRHPLWNWHYRQRGEDLVAFIDLHGHSGEHPLPGRQTRCSAPIPRSPTHRCAVNHLFDVPGLLSVGRQRESLFFRARRRLSSSWQVTTRSDFRSQIADGRRRARAHPSWRTGREEGVPHGWAGLPPR